MCRVLCVVGHIRSLRSVRRGAHLVLCIELDTNLLTCIYSHGCVQVRLGHHTCTTQTIQDTLNPVWSHTCHMGVASLAQNIQFIGEVPLTSLLQDYITPC